jgi:hypothetical protein
MKWCFLYAPLCVCESLSMFFCMQIKHVYGSLYMFLVCNSMFVFVDFCKCIFFIQCYVIVHVFFMQRYIFVNVCWLLLELLIIVWRRWIWVMGCHFWKLIIWWLQDNPVPRGENGMEIPKEAKKGTWSVALFSFGRT